MFKNSIKHLDKKLNRLYKKINEYDKALVVLHSDHGVNFMTQTENFYQKKKKSFFYIKTINH